jgi:hypothetical protein
MIGTARGLDRGPIGEALKPLGLEREIVTIVGGFQSRWIWRAAAFATPARSSAAIHRCAHERPEAEEKMARPKRFELLTPRFVVWCSIQLSYGRGLRCAG